MNIISGDNRVEIDVANIIRRMDDVIHDEITDKSGLVVSHDKIMVFITDIIREHNMKELRIWYEMEHDAERLENERKMINYKIKCGKVVYGVNTFMDKFKYRILGYVDVGEKDNDE